MANSRLTVLIEGKNNLSPTVKQAEKSVSEFTNKSKHLDDVKKKFDKIEDSGMNVAKKLSETKKAMRELALAGETNTKAFEQMRKAAQSYKKTLDDVDKSIKNAGKNPFEKIAGNVGDITSKMGLGNIGSSVASAITNPYILAGTAVVGATKALWDYEVELDRSLQKTAQFTGLSGDELMSLRNGIKSVADTFGTDYDTVLSSVDGMMQQFGISGEEALQILNDGFTSMGEGGAQKVLDLVGKYQGAFNDAGISASELVAIIGNTRSGIFSEEGMELIAMSAKKLREFNKGTQESLEAVGINAEEMFNKIQTGQITTVQAMQQVSERLKDLSPQSKEVGDVFKNVFGKQASSAGMELVSALADVETNLDIVKTQTGEWGDAMQQLQQANREFENAMASLFGVADGGFSNMTTKLKAEVFGAVAKVINGFIEWYNKSLVVRGAIANIALQFKNAWEVIKAILKIFIDSVKGLADVIEGVFTLDWEKVKNGWKNGVQNILKTVATGFENIKENVKDAAEQTLHGEIKIIPVSEETEYSGNNRPITGNGSKLDKGGKKGGSKNGSKSSNTTTTTTKTEVIKTQLELDEEELKKQEDNIKKSIDRFNKGLISKEDLESVINEANKYFEEHNIKSKVELDYNTDDKGFEKATEKKPIKIKTELELKREQFKELEDIVNQTKTDFNNGLIDKDTITKQIDEVNIKLKELGLEPLKLEIDAYGVADVLDSVTVKTKEFEEAQRKAQETATANQQIISSLGSTFNSLGSAIGGSAGDMMNFAGQTIQAISQIIPQIISLIGASEAQAIATGTASGAGLPFPANIAAIASIVATIASVFASLPTFAEGGVIGGGSMVGDHLLARVNSGEMILNGRQQDNLFNAIDNNRLGGGGLCGDVNFRIDGTVIKGVLNNVNRKISKQS